jgi:hypothetical protein
MFRDAANEILVAFRLWTCEFRAPVSRARIVEREHRSGKAGLGNERVTHRLLTLTDLNWLVPISLLGCARSMS